MNLGIERLERAHRKLLDDFQNDVPELVTYLRRWALAHQERDRLSRTWLAVDRGTDPARVAGYYSLAAASLDRAVINSGDLDRLPQFQIPAILLARLATDSRVQGQGIGTWMFDEALRMALALATDGPLGIRVLITDAKDERAAHFYERRGLVAPAPTAWPRRMVLDLKPLVARQ